MNTKGKMIKRITNAAAILTIMFGIAVVPFFSGVTPVYAQDEVTPTEEPALVEESTSEPVSDESSTDGEGDPSAPLEEASAATEEEAVVEANESDAAEAAVEEPVEELSLESGEETAAVEPDALPSSEEDLKAVVEILADTEAVLVDENDNPISLASNEAVDALQVSDPYFTRGGTKYCYVPLGDTPHPSLGCDIWDDVASPIQSAINDVTLNGLPDDGIITVEPGTYEENVVININGLTLYGDPGKETQDGADNSAPVLDGSLINGTGITINADATTIIGFILRNYDLGIAINDAGDVMIKDNTLEDNKVGIKINNTSVTPKKVEVYGNTIKSSQTDSVGLHVEAAGPTSLFGSLNSFMNEKLNVKDESGQDDFELFFNEWGFWDGSSYAVCTISGHQDTDYAGLFTCARVEEVLPKEILLDGSLLPAVFSQDVTKLGEFCLDEKNSDYAIKTESGPGPLTLASGESLSVVAVKQATGCYYELAPIADGPENGVYLDVNGIEECIFVTRSTDEQSGEHSYTFDVASEEGGCGISHVVGYYDPNIEEEPPCEGKSCEEPEKYDLVLDPYCVDVNEEAKLAWEIFNPNNFNVDADWSLDGTNGSGTLAPGTTFIGYTLDGPSSYTLDVSWEFGEASLTSSEVCETPDDTPPSDTPPSDTPPSNTPPGDTPVIEIVEKFLIPVTGADLGMQALLPTGGLLLVGISLIVKGYYEKKKK